MKRLLIIPLIFLIAATNLSGQVKKAETVDLKDNTIYYEVYGEGEPLFFIHGATLSSKYWLPYIFDYTDEYEVYLIDLPGHGNSGPLPENYSMEKIAQQLNELTTYLGFQKIKAIGYSLGGDVLFNLAAYYPDLIESMVTIGSFPRNFKKDFPETINKFSYGNLENLPWIAAYQKSDEQVKNLLNAIKHHNSSLNDEQLSGISARILMVFGDNDLIGADNDQGIPLAEVSRIGKLVPNTNLLVFPNSGHGAHEGDNFEYFVKKSKSFLNGK